MKNKKLLFIIVFLYCCLTLPSIISFSSFGATEPMEIATTTIFGALVFSLLALIVNKIMKQKKAMIFIGVVSVLQLIIALTVVFSTASQLVSLSYKLQSLNKNEITVESETKVTDDMYIVVYEKESKSYCATVRKSLLTYYADTEGFRYYWNEDDVNNSTLSHDVNIPKAHFKESGQIIHFAILSDDVYKAYIGDDEMSVIDLGNINLAYHIDSEEVEYSHDRPVIKKVDSKGNVLYERKI